MTAADLAQSIRRELPYLRRYARALTGSQTAGDNYAVATLEAILSDRSLMDTEDTRILLIDGEPVPYSLARIPSHGENRGNLAAGGRGEGRELTARDREICERVAPVIKEKGLIFVGLDVIGDYLTEINVTSPTCIRELDSLYNISIGAQLMDVIERYKQGN